MSVYKMSVFWSAWTPQVATRIMRDVLAIQRLAKVHKAQFVVAADELLHPKLEAVGVFYTTDFANPSSVRVYLDQGSCIPDEIAARLPECDSLEVVSINGEALPAPTLTVEEDPYAGVKFYQDWKRINETMPLDRKAPPPNSEPLLSPFL